MSGTNVTRRVTPPSSASVTTAPRTCSGASNTANSRASNQKPSFSSSVRIMQIGKCYAPRHAAEFGIGYDRTQNVLWRIEHGELEGIKPKAIVLLIGTNNAGNEDNGKPRNTTPEIVEGVAAIVRELRTRLPESKILLFGIFPRGDTNDPVREQVKEINVQLAFLRSEEHTSELQS